MDFVALTQQREGVVLIRVRYRSLTRFSGRLQKFISHCLQQIRGNEEVLFRLDINISLSPGDLAADGQSVLWKRNRPFVDQPLHFKHSLSL